MIYDLMQRSEDKMFYIRQQEKKAYMKNQMIVTYDYTVFHEKTRRAETKNIFIVSLTTSK